MAARQSIDDSIVQYDDNVVSDDDSIQQEEGTTKSIKSENEKGALSQTI